MVNHKLVKKGISTVTAILLLIILAVATSVIIYAWRVQQFNGFILSGYPANVYSGEVFGVAVTAVDQYGNPFTSYTGPVYFTSTDTNFFVPNLGTKTNPYKFIGGDNGVHTFELRLNSIGSHTITVTDGTKSKTSNPITVNPEPILDHFEFSTISSPQTAGSDFGVTVTAIDQYGNTLTSYSGTPTLTYSAGSITPTTLNPLSSGVGAATVRVTTAGTGVTITATDATVTGMSDPFDVNPASASVLKVGALPTATVDAPFTVTVTAKDQYGNTAMGYLGTVHFTSNDGAATLPGDYTFIAYDQGMHTFINGVTLKAAINWSITATDTATPSITGSHTGSVPKPPTLVSFGNADQTYDYGSIYPEYPTNLQANDLILLQVVGDANYPSYTPAGFTLLYGPDQSGLLHQWIYYKFADGTESGKKMVLNYGGQCSKSAWMYAFRNVALTNFTEAESYGSGNSSFIAAQPVTTMGSNRLAVSFFFVGSSSVLDHSYDNFYGFEGEMGGNWDAPFSYASQGTTYTGGINLAFQVQVAKMDVAGTISGGSYTIAYPDSWGVRAFALKP